MNAFVSPNDMVGNSDSARISAAIQKAKASGVNKVVIPRYNKRTDSQIWVIEDRKSVV